MHWVNLLSGWGLNNHRGATTWAATAAATHFTLQASLLARFPPADIRLLGRFPPTPLTSSLTTISPHQTFPLPSFPEALCVLPSTPFTRLGGKQGLGLAARQVVVQPRLGLAANTVERRRREWQRPHQEDARTDQCQQSPLEHTSVTKYSPFHSCTFYRLVNESQNQKSDENLWLVLSQHFTALVSQS